MKKRVVRLIGIVFLLIGFLVLLNSLQGITGFVIIEDVDIKFGYYIGIWFFISGIVLLLVEEIEEIRNREGKLIKIIKTPHFEKAIRRHNVAAINRALEKIGTGLGQQERLKHIDAYSIRVTNGGRIVFNRKNEDTYVLLDYTPVHEYD